MRMSDILRGGLGREEFPEKKPTLPGEKKSPEPPPSPEGAPPLFQMRSKEPEAPPRVPSETLYDTLLEFVKNDLFVRAKEGRSIDGLEIQRKIEPLLDRVAEQTGDLMYLAITRSTPDYYLYAHAVNVAILALRLGVGLGYDREALLTVGVGALLHDIGMVKVMDIAQKEAALTPQEYEEIKKHTQYSVDILKNVKDLSSVCLYIAENAHERNDGTGYPRGITGQQLSEQAQIVAIVDVYEALTHSRSYRDKLLPYEALKEILKNKDLFHPKILKTFVQHITVYPIGCWAELSTGEVGRVVNANPELPLRPTVKLFYDNQMRPFRSEKQLDLAKHSTIYIKRVLDEKELQERKEKGLW